MTRLVPALALLLAACAGGSSGSAQRAPDGHERGDCYGNGTCNDGLMCLSNVCVRPPPADCAKVAKALDYLTLGNYAPAAERTAFDERVARECQAAMLTKEEGDCILAAKSRQQLAECPKPMVLGDCAKMADYVLKVVAPREPGTADFRDREGMIAQCKELGVTKEQEACVLKALSAAELRTCVGK
jgi:hypothetical protein